MDLSIENKKFSNLTVIRYSGQDHGYSCGRANDKKYLCECDCGNICLVRRSRLISGHTKSCGCLQKKAASKTGKKSRLSIGEKPLNDLFSNYKRSAKLRCIEFNLTKDEFRSVINHNCYYCDLPPSNKQIHPRIKDDCILYSGIDRLNSKLGYRIDNIVPCCKFCNLAKASLTEEEFYQNIKRIYEALHKKCRI